MATPSDAATSREPTSTETPRAELRPASLTQDDRSDPTSLQKNAPQQQIIKGTGIFINQQSLDRSDASETATGDIVLNFVNADIRDVARAVLADMLGLAYTIDPGVTGTITFQSTRPMAREAVLPAFEAVLALHNSALVFSQGLYQVLPSAAAQKAGAAFTYDRSVRDPAQGYALQIVPLNYVTANEMAQILEPFAPKGSIVRIDKARNFLILAGSGAELATLIDTVELFDVNMLEGMSFAILPVTQVEAGVLADDIRGLLERVEGSIAELVELIAIPRINAILVISPQPQYLTEVQRWIQRLDLRSAASSRQIFFYPLQNAKAEDVAQILNEILGFAAAVPKTASTEPTDDEPETVAMTPLGGNEKARVVADVKNNALIIFATSAEYDLIESSIRQMDLAPDQVFIEAAIAEVTLTDELRYGVQFFLENAESRITLSEVAGGAIASMFPGFSYSYTVSDARAVLNALGSITNVNVISSPKLMTVNNETASLQVGDQVPVATQSAVSINDPDAPIVNSVQFRDTGVILEVTPRINKSGMVIMEIAQEVSDVAETTSSGIDSPTIQQRKVSSTVAVEDGMTVALGGLIREVRSKTKSGVPIISKIPVIGFPFGATNKTARRTELLIFITPHIVRNMADAKAVTDYLRGQLRNSVFFGKAFPAPEEP